MSLFGSTPPEASPSMHSSFAQSRQNLFENDSQSARDSSDNLFNDDDAATGPDSPWDMPTPRKQQNRAELLRKILPASDVPDTYIEIYDRVLGEYGSGHRVSAAGVAHTLAASQLGADQQSKITSILTLPDSGELTLGRNEFNALLAMIGLAQEGDIISLDGVDERRRNLPEPKLPGLDRSRATPTARSELAAKPPQNPTHDPETETPSKVTHGAARKVTMEYPEDPWNTPDVHKGHQHESASKSVDSLGEITRVNGHDLFGSVTPNGGAPRRTTSSFTTSTTGSSGAAIGGKTGDVRQNDNGLGQSPGGGWNYFDGNAASGAGFGQPSDTDNPGPISPFGGAGGDPHRNDSRHDRPAARTLGNGRMGNPVEETIVVSLMPEKEGVFMFRHHNYEVSSARRGSKVVRRYSDFVWLLNCLHKRYPFRVLPLLPPKRVAVNGNHLSNDGGFIEKRRRGLSRFLNALVRHPVLGQEQLVIMFLTVPTELSVWRKQATISVQDEFTGRALPAGLEESLTPQLNELFDRVRAGVRRSAEIYINVCNIMDRLVKRSEGVAADHARIAASLQSLTEVSSDTYASDTNNVPLLNDGLVSMSKHLQTSQTLMEDESKAWELGVLEDLKRQRDALVSVREVFDRRDTLDKDNIPTLERRIQNNETKLAGLRAKPEGLVKPGEIERVVEAIIKDKESIVDQHNRSIFVKECIRDELVYFQTTQYHVSRWNQDWAQERVKYAEMLADNWRRLLDELDGMPLGD